MPWSTSSRGATTLAWMPAFSERWSSLSDRSWGVGSSIPSLGSTTPSRSRVSGRRTKSRTPRHLDSMALQYGYTDSVRSMERQRQQRIATADVVRTDVHHSTTMSRTGKTLFEQAVSHAQSDNDDRLSRVSSTVGGSLPTLTGRSNFGRSPTYACQHSGPTKYGSPIYWDRSRSPIGPVSLQPTEREVRLREHLKQLNRTHRVICPDVPTNEPGEMPQLSECVIVRRETAVGSEEEPPPPLERENTDSGRESSGVVEAPNMKPDRGKTWLDDATISSPAHEEEQEGQQNAEVTTATEAPESTIKDQPSRTETPVVVNLADLGDTEIEITLPDLICPSSEVKSREYGVRHWLKTTSFPCALRTAPLL